MQADKIKYISHEIKNQLSICDLYTEILEKYCAKNHIGDETILKAVQSIKRAVQMSGNSLLELKAVNNTDIREYELGEILKESYELSKVYAASKNISISLKSDIKTTVSVDKTKFQAIIINLVKNACEAFKDEDNKIIKISASQKDKNVKIKVSNNAEPISEPDKIFQEGVTTKSTGSGLGLYISRQNANDISGSLQLLKSDKISTEFELTVKSI